MVHALVVSVIGKHVVHPYYNGRDQADCTCIERFAYFCMCVSAVCEWL